MKMEKSTTLSNVCTFVLELGVISIVIFHRHINPSCHNKTTMNLKLKCLDIQMARYRQIRSALSRT